MTRRTMYKITIHYVSPLPRVSDGDGFSGLELARVKLNPRHHHQTHRAGVITLLTFVYLCFDSVIYLFKRIDQILSRLSKMLHRM